MQHINKKRCLCWRTTQVLSLQVPDITGRDNARIVRKKPLEYKIQDVEMNKPSLGNLGSIT